MMRPGRPPIRGAGHIEGLGWARFLAWVGLVLGFASLALALFAPLAGEESRVVWIVVFASFAVWFGLMAGPRYRSARGRGSIVAKLGAGLGIVTLAIAIYALIAIVLASYYGTRIPAPAHWLDGREEPVVTVETVAALDTGVGGVP